MGDSRKNKAFTKKAGGDRNPPYRGNGGDNDERDKPNGEREIFEKMVQRRLGGGRPPTSEDYATAMEQWQKLPGAIRSIQLSRTISNPENSDSVENNSQDSNNVPNDKEVES